MSIFVIKQITKHHHHHHKISFVELIVVPADGVKQRITISLYQKVLVAILKQIGRQIKKKNFAIHVEIQLQPTVSSTSGKQHW